jgi:phage tail protein X
MRAYRFQGEKSLTELARKLYDIDKKGLTASAVGQQLAKANPGLNLAAKSLGKAIPPEALIMVPDIDGTNHTAAGASFAETAVDAVPPDKLIDPIAAAIEWRHDAEMDRLKNELNTLETLIAELSDDELRETFEKFKSTVEEQISAIEAERSSAAGTMDRAKQVLARQQKLLKQG